MRLARKQFAVAVLLACSLQLPRLALAAGPAEDVEDPVANAPGESDSSLPWYRPNENEAFKTPAPPPPPPPPPRVEHTTITLDLGLTTRVFVEGSVQGATTEFDARFGVKWFGFDVGILGPGGEYVVGVNFFRDAAVAVSHDSQGGQWRILFPYIGLDYLGGSSPSFVRLGAPGAIGVRYTLCKGEQSPLPCAVHADLRVAGVELWMPTQSLQVSTFPVSVTVFTLDVGAFF